MHFFSPANVMKLLEVVLMLAQRGRASQELLNEGALPWEIDRALYDFGFAMGPFQMSDLAGLDIGWVKEKSNGESIRDR